MSPRRLLLLAAALSAWTALPAFAAQDCEVNGESVSPYNGSTTAGKTGIMRCKDRDTGLMVREQELRAGKFTGLVRRYDKGQLRDDYSENDKGNRHGRFRSYGEDGKLVRDVEYDNGSESGLARSFHPGSTQLRRVTWYDPVDGERAYAEFTARGQLRGLRCADRPRLAPLADDARWCGFGSTPAPVDFFSDRGQLTARTTYVAGKRTRHETFNDNGNPSYRDEVTASARTEQYFSTAGVKKREITWALDPTKERGRQAQRVREQDFADSGTLVRDRRWADGQPLSDHVYYLNGQLRSKAEYSGPPDAMRMQTSDYYDSGRMAATGAFILTRRGRDQPTGSFQRFDEAGTLVSEAVYDDKGKVTREKTWDADGRLLRDDEVFEDGSRKAFSR